jgi:hypothetical protein
MTGVDDAEESLERFIEISADPPVSLRDRL